MKKIFNSLSLFQKSLPIFLFIFLIVLFRKIDSNILLDYPVADVGRLSTKIWTYLFRSGIMPLVYSLSLLFIFLNYKDKNEEIKILEPLGLLSTAFLVFGILGLILSIGYSDIFLIVAIGLTSSLFFIGALFLAFLLILFAVLI